jgi:hypothetical protein
MPDKAELAADTVANIEMVQRERSAMPMSLPDSERLPAAVGVAWVQFVQALRTADKPSNHRAC